MINDNDVKQNPSRRRMFLNQVVPYIHNLIAGGNGGSGGGNTSATLVEYFCTSSSSNGRNDNNFLGDFVA